MGRRSHAADRATRVEKFRRRPRRGARALRQNQSQNNHRNTDTVLSIMAPRTTVYSRAAAGGGGQPATACGAHRSSQEVAMISFTVNGKERQVDVPPEMPLLWGIRETLNLTGTKYGCGIPVCGACTVHVDGTAVRACVAPASAGGGRRVDTIEGVSGRGPHPGQRGGA